MPERNLLSNISHTVEFVGSDIYRVPRLLKFERGLRLKLLEFSIHRPGKSFPYRKVPAAFIDEKGSRLIIATGEPVVNEDSKPFDVLQSDGEETNVNFTYINPKTSELVTFNLPHLVALLKP